MKKQILVLLLPILFSMSCTETGEIQQQPVDFIIIHGKTYKLMQVTPKANSNAIWILYPKDSLDSMPTVMNYDITESSGKHTTSKNNTVIKVD